MRLRRRRTQTKGDGELEKQRKSRGLTDGKKDKTVGVKFLLFLSSLRTLKLGKLKDFILETA